MIDEPPAPQPAGHEPAGHGPAGPAGRRELTAAALGCLVASGLVLVAVGRPWVRFTVATSTDLDVRTTVTGHEVAGASSALGLVVLAGVVALPATRRVSRLIVGGLMVLAGIGILVATWSSAFDASAAIASRARQVGGRSGARATQVAATAWPWLVLAGGVLAVMVGVVTLLRSRRWPAMGRRYEAGRGPSRGRPNEVSMWDRLDEGDDPTV